VVIGGGEQRAHFFALDLPHSDACFVRAYPEAVSEAWVDGHVHALAFFGRVPQSVLYDNDRCLVAKILPDGTRKRAKLFSGFLSHYLIHDRYGGPGEGNDKGAVEGLVGYARRNFTVPIPCFATWDALNVWLAEQCRSSWAISETSAWQKGGAVVRRNGGVDEQLPAVYFNGIETDQQVQAVNQPGICPNIREKFTDRDTPVNTEVNSPRRSVRSSCRCSGICAAVPTGRRTTRPDRPDASRCRS
jgi:hypothetical protein